jgi:hypothetical protein
VSHAYESWWSALRHGGLLIAPSRLHDVAAQDPPPLSRHVQDRLRRELNAFADSPKEQLASLLDTVLEEILGLKPEQWLKAAAVPASWSRQLVTGDNEKPRRVWLGPQTAALPVFTTQEPRIGVGRGRRAAARVIEWLRRANQKIALLTNGRQWRLIHAGPDYEAWCEWDTELWFEQGEPGPQLLALCLLLSDSALSPDKAGAPSPLLRAIAETRRGESELTQDMGERVREAVEMLIFGSAGVLNEIVGAGERQVSSRDIYTAAVRLIMRCVVVLFAEARGLLPREEKMYEDSYGIQSLREQLDRIAGGNARSRLRHTQSAWPRLVTLFRLVYQGSVVSDLPVQAYGGTLFEPGDPDSPDAVLRAIAAFENPEKAPYDLIVYEILDRLTRATMMVRQGASSRPVAVPVDFYGLGTEYIGILYEGLLDYELRRRDDDVTVFLNIGECPALPLESLRQLSGERVAGFFERFQVVAKKSADEADGEEAGDADDAETEDSDAAEETNGEKAATALPITPAALPIEDLSDGDQKRAWREKVEEWARDAVAKAKLVKAPRSKASAAQERYRAEVADYARKLVGRIVMPGEWFLVRYGNTRKGTGTFYTRPQPAGPIARRALQPLAYQPAEHDAAGRVTAWRVREPHHILGLKVCDPAMGSGSFLIAALRYLTDALHESLYAHGRIAAHGENGAICRLADGMPVDSIENETFPVPPDHPDFDVRLKAKLRRHIVERCLYGVDIDALAIELGRISLWIETMDRELPFGFLDHKLKPGNSLVGCWFDRFLDYPAAAWLREGGDKDNDRFVHHFRQTKGKKGQPGTKGDPWTDAINQKRKVVAGRLVETIRAGADALLFSQEMHTADDVHDRALTAFEELHRLPVEQADRRRDRYRELQEDPTYRKLRQAFDLWCAIWFWPADRFEHVPMPDGPLAPSEDACAIVRELRKQYRFFHWELEFPDVFTGKAPGFHAVIGNPPWEVQKPNSKEFFSNYDPLYRGYGKQEALGRQFEYFQVSPEVEHSWMAYRARFKALSNWTKHAGSPFGDRIVVESNGRESHVFPLASHFADSERFHSVWRDRRATRHSYAGREHPFLHQGSADINTYKMFLETAWAITRPDGHVGMLVPSGVYSDKGASDLRAVFRERSRWTHLYVFQNERFIFPAVHHSFKVAMVAVEKGGSTDKLLARFRLGPGGSPEIEELEDDVPDESRYLTVEAEQIRRFSPTTGAVLEVCNARDLDILEKLYANGVLLGDRGPDGWGIQYVREFDMTNDSALFPPREKWEAKGYSPDEYGHWLKGEWKAYDGPQNILDRPDGLILSADGLRAVHVDEVEDVALPLYQGAMVHHFDYCAAAYRPKEGKRGFEWKPIPWGEKTFEPKFLMCAADYHGWESAIHTAKFAFRDVARTTDATTFIGTACPDMPCGNTLGVVSVTGDPSLLAATVNSFAVNRWARLRMAGTHLNLFVIREIAVCRPSSLERLRLFASALCVSAPLFARQWVALEPRPAHWGRALAVTHHERVRLRCILDAAVSEIFCLSESEYAAVLADCDRPAAWLEEKANSRSLDTKGFWRVERKVDPELRQTVLAQVAFQELKRVGLDRFLSLNGGEGWMLPDKLRLADYGLGHDDRAREPQPVASALGPRFYPWQCERSAEDSWRECELHADLLRRIEAVNDEPEPEVEDPPTDLFGNPLEVNLFGEVIVPGPR